ncbi:MAG: NirD/YgiW/YdeI family stress tolerance protein [Alishewanella agri]|nr:NirD/YgiW/YdeI family stress tolerance protein [Alishewanella agri]NLW03651.1 NirD/YgiW/YdeI family stress tolerance protein [Pseudomonadaceae bacterium]
MRILKYGVLVMVLSGLSFSSIAQYTGPGHLVKTDLAQILDKPVDDDLVKLQGYLVKKVSSDKYLFSDGKNQIRVEIDQDVFPPQPFDDKDLIQIEGEVEKDFLESPEIDVKRLTVIKK